MDGNLNLLADFCVQIGAISPSQREQLLEQCRCSPAGDFAQISVEQGYVGPEIIEFYYSAMAAVNRTQPRKQ